MVAENLRKKSRLHRLVIAAANGFSPPAAARASGYSERHARDLLISPDIARQVAELQAQIWRQAATQLASANILAIQKLRQLLRSGDQRLALSAARSILEQSVKLRDAAAVEDRLAAIELRFNALARERSP